MDLKIRPRREDSKDIRLLESTFNNMTAKEKAVNLINFYCYCQEHNLNDCWYGFEMVEVYFYDEESKKYIGVDNRSGDCWVEEFDSEEDCIKWINDDEEVQEQEPTLQEKIRVIRGVARMWWETSKNAHEDSFKNNFIWRSMGLDEALRILTDNDYYNEQLEKCKELK